MWARFAPTPLRSTPDLPGELPLSAPLCSSSQATNLDHLALLLLPDGGGR